MWEDLDFLFIDMPPGTGDVALTVFQSIPVDEVVIVSTPQDLVSMIVGKAVNMCKMMNISVLGLVENMSYMECPCCKEHLHPFGNSKIEEVSLDYHLTALDQMPIQPEVASLVDQGLIEEADPSVLDKAAKALENLIK